MITFGFGGQGTLSLEEELALQEQLALKMVSMLEEKGGWYSSYGRDPLFILLEYEESELNPNDEE
jgi:hypothetical protein